MARIIKRSRKTLRAYRHRGKHRAGAAFGMVGAMTLVAAAPWPYGPTPHSL